MISVINGYNHIIWSKNEVIQSLATIDVMLKNRFDLLPNLITTVKQFSSHEEFVVETVTSLRSQVTNASNGSQEYFDSSNQLIATMKSLFSVSEKFPQLKSDSSFLKLQSQLERIEDKIQGARRLYNNALKDYRNSKEQFPTNIIANTLQLPSYAMYEIQESEAINIAVSDTFVL